MNKDKLDILYEYGEAIRGYWGEIDGRQMRGEIQDIAEWIRDDDSSWTREKIRLRLNICPLGNGHWAEYCKDYDLTEGRK